MGFYILLRDRARFADLDRCLFLLPTEEQESRHEEDLSNGDVRSLVADPDVERVELSLDFLRRVLRSTPPPTRS
ncbi:MAG: hypothetical protein O7H41_03765 [Planctomycetota bacterium]|nr:hypothetical protein [Planctomycetota bacterium]